MSADLSHVMTDWLAKQAKLRPMTDTEREALGHSWTQIEMGWFRCDCGAILPDLSPSWFLTPIVEGDEPCECLVCAPHGEAA